MHAPVRRRAAILFVTFTGALALSAPASARQDADDLARANTLAEAGPGTRAVEDVLFTPLAAMQPEPAWMQRDRARFIACLPGAKDWPEAEAWINADPQRQIITALAQCTDLADGAKWVLGIPYGSDAAPADWTSAGLVATLRQGDLLATAEFPYFERIRSLADLATLEVYRLAHADDAEAALNTATDLLILGRIITDRPFVEESMLGYELMARALVVMRDAVYTYPDTFRDKQALVDAVAHLDDREIKYHQFRFPAAERVAAEQLAARVIRERGPVDEPRYVATLSSLTSADRPLRRFGQAERWRQAAAMQSDWFETQAAVDRVWGDYAKRWAYDFANAEHARPTDRERLAGPQHQMIAQLAQGIDRVFPARRAVTAEIGATRVALACVAWKLDRFDWPPKTTTSLPLRPHYLRYIDEDPYNYFERSGVYRPFKYFVPIRDDVFGPREDPHPHTVVASINPDRPYASDLNQAGALTLYGGTLTAIRDEGKGPAASRAGQGASGGMQGEEAGGGAEILAPIVQDLAAFYDFQQGRIDPQRYAEFLRDRGTSDERAELQQLVIAMKAIDPSLTSTSVNWPALVDRILNFVPPDAPPNASLRNLYNSMGLDADLVKNVMVAQYEAVMADPTARPGIAKILDGSTPTVPDHSNLEQALKRILVTEDLLQKQSALIQQILTGPMGESVRAMMSARDRFVTFNTTIDDTQFILYSVGPDRYDNRARNVGAEGDDIIYWPPLIALYRQSITPAAN